MLTRDCGVDRAVDLARQRRQHRPRKGITRGLGAVEGRGADGHVQLVFVQLELAVEIGAGDADGSSSAQASSTAIRRSSISSSVKSSRAAEPGCRRAQHGKVGADRGKLQPHHIVIAWGIGRHSLLLRVLALAPCVWRIPALRCCARGFSSSNQRTEKVIETRLSPDPRRARRRQMPPKGQFRTRQAPDRPLVLRSRAEPAVEAVGRLVPVQDRPFDPP